MILDGFGVAGFRSFGNELVYIRDLTKINIFIGKNNSGKSNILRFSQHLSSFSLSAAYAGFSSLDYSVDSNVKDIWYALQIKKDSQATGKIYHKIGHILPEMNTKFPEWNNCIWFKNSIKNLGRTNKAAQEVKELKDTILKKYTPYETDSIAGIILGYTGGSPESRAADIAMSIL